MKYRKLKRLQRFTLKRCLFQGGNTMTLSDMMYDLSKALQLYGNNEASLGKDATGKEMEGWYEGRASAFRQSSQFILDRLTLHNVNFREGGD